MKQIVTYIGYAMAVWGVVTTIWLLSAKNTRKEYDVSDLKKDVTELKNNMVTKHDMQDLRDSLQRFVLRSERVDKKIADNYNSLRRSYVTYLKDNTSKIDNLIKYLNGIEFELNVPRPDSTDFKMIIKKKVQ